MDDSLLYTKKVKDLHEKGLSLRQIAKVLSEMKIITKSQGNRWHQEMVRKNSSIYQILLTTDRLGAFYTLSAY